MPVLPRAGRRVPPPPRRVAPRGPSDTIPRRMADNDHDDDAPPALERITILGDGAMATVCSILLNTGGHEVTLWGAFEQSIEALLQDRENRKLLPGARVPPQVRLTANDAECFAG